MRLLLAAAIVAAGVAPAWAQTKPGGSMSDWFRSLRTPEGQSCCDESDCARTQSRLGPSGYQAQTPAGEWVDVPNDRILRRDNPTGVPVMCWLPHRGVICFVPGVEA